ncbi:MAG TPA: hypothetical protein VMV99_01775 [Rhodanobacter sp.]|nr:hypothetical protein [Rhodanobacter sp.]
MSDEPPKNAANRLNDTLAQLKEMRHYARNNVEMLTAEWLLFDGELSKLKKADAIADLMDRQSQLHDAMVSVIEDLEDTLAKLPPEPTE